MERIKIKRRIYGELSPAKMRQVRKWRKQIATELPDMVRRHHKTMDALKEKTFSGALRRAIHDHPIAPWRIAEKAELTWMELSDFLTGEKSLTSDVIDRLLKVLKLKLQTSKTKSRPRTARAG
ncbi:MAG: hypothetical protein L0215_19655 [Gemmataceae bacterium]|nr:hypothetical protein [Gemmataceae bacterium]